MNTILRGSPYRARARSGSHLRGWLEKKSNKTGYFAFVIASQCNVGGFADVALGEAIQFFLPKDWIASSQGLLAMTNSDA